MDRLTGRKPTPAQSAKDRLKFVLVTDRTTISPEDLRKMQSEILDVIRKYCRINEDAVDMKFEQRDRENYLVADIPLTAGRPDEPVGSVRIQTSITTSEDDIPEDKKDDEGEAEKPAEDTKPSADMNALDGDTLKLNVESSEEKKPEAESSASEDEKKKDDD
jgi:cell division topological specificity factor